MNKLLIVLLAVCLVSVHAFVKRDAPAAESNTASFDLDTLMKQGQEIFNQAQATLKEQAGNLKDTAEKVLEEIKQKIDAANKGAATAT